MKKKYFFENSTYYDRFELEATVKISAHVSSVLI